MAEHPSVGFATNVKDEELTQEIIRAIAEEFDGEIKHQKVQLDPSFEVLYGVLENEYSPSYGIEADGLVLTYSTHQWMNWGQFSEVGDKMQEIAEFIDKAFEHVDVEDTHPVVRHT